MCKTIRNQFDEKLTFTKLIEAHERAKKDKISKREVLLFEMDLETNIMNLYNRLKNDTYEMGKYREFIIYEPKERLIKSLPYIDRVVQQWYIDEFIKPFIVPRFINDSYACILNRETHKAVKNLQKYLKKLNDCYIFQCNIKKFFYSIDKDLLYKVMCKYISDKKLLSLTKKFIFDSKEKLSIPIGNYTSQYYANIFLNELDYYVKNSLKILY